LNLSHEKLVSKFAFKLVNLCRYSEADLAANIEMMKRISDMAKAVSAKAAEQAGVTAMDGGLGHLSGGYADGGGGGGFGGDGLGYGGGGGGDKGEAHITFEQKYEGKIIGKAGSVIMEMQSRYGVNIKIARNEGHLTITGPDDGVAAAKAAILEICLPQGGGYQAGALTIVHFIRRNLSCFYHLRLNSLTPLCYLILPLQKSREYLG
jgi:hypothetical protein